MGKKNRKKWWMSSTDNEEDPATLFPNSTRQHSKKEYLTDDAEFIYQDDNGNVASPFMSDFDWGLDRKLVDNSGSKTGIDRYKSASDDFQRGYGGGGWRGYDYYKQPQLSYKYVQQMANMLAAEHKITVQVGSEWKVDLKAKKLTYNPASLIYGTKSELLATLMHEIGKLRYCQHPDELKEKYLAMYGVPAFEALSIFEDVRADYHMLKAYESAGDIYESAIPLIDKKIKEYKEMSVKVRKMIPEAILVVLREVVDRTMKQFAGFSSDIQNQKVREQLKAAFGEEDPKVIQDKLLDIAKTYDENGSIFDFCGEMLHVMYDTDAKPTEFENIKNKVALCEPSIEPVKKKLSSQDLVNLLSTDVFPHIEDLFQDFRSNNQKMQDMFPGMAQQIRAEVESLIQQYMANMGGSQNGGRVNTGRDGNSISRTSGPNNINAPQEWFSGDYKILKDTVMAEVKELVSKLTFLRREEQTVKFEHQQKRGKINARALYKSATGSKRVFKQKLPNIDTVQSFAFSVLIDTSGSMSGNRIAHTTRALVILGEVFKRMDIPFEIITFADGAKHVKKFGEVIDKNLEKRIAGLANKASGSTELRYALDLLQLEKQPQQSKVCVVLTDGGVGDHKWFDQNYFIPMQKRGVLSIAFGLECGDDVKHLCMGNSVRMDNASSLPFEFARLVKSLIKRKK
jgi:hypothetical protein